MKSIFLSIVAILQIQCLAAQIKYSPQVEAQIQQVENHLAGRIQIAGQPLYNIGDRMAHYNVKGLSLAVVHNYEIVWAKGYGWADEAGKRPVTPETLFEPGSISKTFNALGILKLVQDNKLKLNADINSYLKSWKFPYDSLAQGKKITLADLLSHTAGLSVHGFGGYNRFGKIPTLPQILDGKGPTNSSPVRSEFAPGLRYQYSGGGTTISQLILQEKTKQPYDEWMRANVLLPLGMENSYFAQPPKAAQMPLVATGYRENGSEVDDKFHVYPEQGAAGLWTTPTDICKYIIETQRAYEGKSAKLLNQQMTQLRLTPYQNDDAALGVFIEDREGVKYFQHGAGNEGFRGFYYGSLEGGDGVAVFVNSDNGDIMFELMNSVASVYNWKSFYTPLVKEEVEVSEAYLQPCIGVYLVEDQFVTIVKKADGYYLSQGGASKMHFSSPDDFFNLESLTEKHLLHDASGNVTGFARKAKGMQLADAVKIQNPDTLNGNADRFNAIGWHLLGNSEFAQAERYLQRGAVLYPTNLFVLGNLAHSLLFQGKYADAMALYKTYMGQNLQGEMSWEGMILEDFGYFAGKGLETASMQKVLDELKLKTPEGFGKH
jgi:CubicO group peptidase (beta-lactamase class C family)